MNTLNYFKTDCFEYTLTEIKSQHGWQLKALPGVQEFKCPSMINRYPVISLNSTFAKYKYEDIDISQMDTSNVISMNNTFMWSNIKEIDLSKLNLEKIGEMEQCFKECKTEKIKFGSINAERLWSMIEAFYGCENLVEVDLSNFKAPILNYTNYLFFGCSKLKILDARCIEASKILFEMINKFDKTNSNLDYAIMLSDKFYKYKDLFKEYTEAGVELVVCAKDQIDKTIQKLRLVGLRPVCIIVKR